MEAEATNRWRPLRRLAFAVLVGSLLVSATIGPASAADPDPALEAVPSPEPTASEGPPASPASEPSQAPAPSPVAEPTPEPTPTPSAAPTPSPGPSAAPPPLPAWRGSVNLYRYGQYSKQLRSYWCVPASVQMALNIIRGRKVRSWNEQYAFYNWGRARNRYKYRTRGLDPQSWELLLDRHTGTDHRWVSAASYNSALRYAARRLRLTGKPVGLLVGHGSHAWVMTGFSATADPAVTTAFTVTSVWVMGPLYGTSWNRYGFDKPPNTRMSASRLRYYLTPYRDTIRTVWNGRYVVVTA